MKSFPFSPTISQIHHTDLMSNSPDLIPIKAGDHVYRVTRQSGHPAVFYVSADSVREYKGNLIFLLNKTGIIYLTPGQWRDCEVIQCVTYLS